MTRLPIVGADSNAWGTLLNGFLAVAHNANGTLKTVYNVLDYGALGDGSTDDAAAIQSAIAACQSAGGGTVLFPGGKTYLIQSSLTVTADNIQLAGVGWSSIIKAGASMTSLPMIWVEGPGGSAYRAGFKAIDLFLNGNSVTGVIGFQLDSTYHGEIQHCWIRYCVGNGIYLNGTVSIFGAYNIISGCTITDGGAGIGILTHDSEHALITGCKIFWYNSTNGIGIKIANSGCLIAQCAFDECYESIRLEFCLGASIHECDFDRSGLYAVHFHGAKNCHLIGSQFGSYVGGGTGYAIYVEDSGNDRNIIADSGTVASSGWTDFYFENANTGGTNNIINNDVAALPISRKSGIFRSNLGYNPVGNIAAPTMTATTVAYTNILGVDCAVFIVASGATITAIAIGGTATGLTSGSFRVPANQTITLTYTGGTPTWTWFGD